MTLFIFWRNFLLSPSHSTLAVLRKFYWSSSKPTPPLRLFPVRSRNHGRTLQSVPTYNLHITYLPVPETTGSQCSNLNIKAMLSDTEIKPAHRVSLKPGIKTFSAGEQQASHSGLKKTLNFLESRPPTVEWMCRKIPHYHFPTGTNSTMSCWHSLSAALHQHVHRRIYCIQRSQVWNSTVFQWSVINVVQLSGPQLRLMFKVSHSVIYHIFSPIYDQNNFSKNPVYSVLSC